MREYFANRDKEQQYLSIAIRQSRHHQSKLVGFSLQDQSVNAFRVISTMLIAEDGTDKLFLIFSALGQLSEPVYHHFKTLSEAVKKPFIDFIIAVSQTKTDDEFIGLVVNTISNPTSELPLYFCSKQSSATNETLTAMMQSFIADFYIHMQTRHNPLEILDNIIIFIQRCEQLHPFSDGNCRVFCMLLLNHLLIQHGFPFAILFDPNRFDGFSRAELRCEVLRGMENTFLLLENKRLYGISTQHALNLFEEKNKQELLNNFKSVNQLLVSSVNGSTLMKM